MNYILFLSFFLHLFCAVYCRAQHHIINHFTTYNGLPSSQVYDVIQDDHGYIWIATDRGLVKYNGYTFKTFNMSDGLTDNCILHFYKHDDGVIWCITLNNTLFYITNDGTFKPYDYNSILKKELGNEIINEILISNGCLYISFITNGGYLKLNQDGTYINLNTELDFKYYISHSINNHIFNYKLNSDSIPFDNVNSLIVNAEIKDTKRFEALTLDSVGVISFGRDLYLIQNDKRVLIQNEYESIGMGVIDSSYFWVGYRYGGVVIYTMEGKVYRRFLSQKSVSGLCIDHENGMWLTTLNSGIYKFNQEESRIHPIGQLKKAISLTSNKLNQVFIGYYDGTAYRLNSENRLDQIHKSSIEYPIEVQYYNCIDDVLIDDKLSVFSSQIPYVFQDSISTLNLTDNIYNEIIACGIKSFAVLKDTFNIHITPFRVNDVEATKGGYFIGTLNGLYYYLNDTDSIIKVEGSELYKYRIDDIDGVNSTFYAASLGAGLLIIKEDTIFNLDSKSGLYSDLITEVIIENDSVIWTCSNLGLNKVVFHFDGSYEITGISNSEGLPSSEVFDIEVVDSIIYVATANGVAWFHSSFMEEKDSTDINHYLSIQSTDVNYHPVIKEQLVDLRYDENRLTVLYEAISFKSNHELLYRYKLEGLENKWNYTASLQAIYPSIPFGSFNFILQVKNKYGGNWFSNQIQIPVKIHPPFYRRYSFIAGIFTIVCIILYLFFKYNILSFNRHISRKLIIQFMCDIVKDDNYIRVKEQGTEIKIKICEILFVKSDRNYIEIITLQETYIIRKKISDFLESVPNPDEFLRIHRSYIIRIDKVTKKNTSSVCINDISIPIGKSYKENFKHIIL